MRRIAVFAVAIAAALAVAGLAYAESQPPDPSLPAEAPTGSAAEAGERAPGPMKGAIHGQLLLWSRDGGTREVVFDRGRLVSVSETSIALERPDDQTVSATVTSETKFNGTPRDQLKAGDPVMVVQSPDGKALRVVSKGAVRRACKADPAARPRLCRRLGRNNV